MNALENHIRLRLRELRIAKGWTIEGLANRVGLSQASVSRMENGQQGICVAHLDSFARTIEVDPATFLRMQETPNDRPENVDEDEAIFCLHGYFDRLTRERRTLQWSPAVRAAVLNLYAALLDEPAQEAAEKYEDRKQIVGQP